jgi:predicted RNA polymerase sigma factor
MTNHTYQAVYNSDWGRIVATLIRSFGDFDLAEEAAQEAFAAAVDQFLWFWKWSVPCRRARLQARRSILST